MLQGGIDLLKNSGSLDYVDPFGLEEVVVYRLVRGVSFGVEV